MLYFHADLSCDHWTSVIHVVVTCPAVGSVTMSALLEEEEDCGDVLIILFTTEVANFFSQSVGGASGGWDMI